MGDLPAQRAGGRPSDETGICGTAYGTVQLTLHHVHLTGRDTEGRAIIALFHEGHETTKKNNF